MKKVFRLKHDSKHEGRSDLEITENIKTCHVNWWGHDTFYNSESQYYFAHTQSVKNSSEKLELIFEKIDSKKCKAAMKFYASYGGESVTVRFLPIELMDELVKTIKTYVEAGLKEIDVNCRWEEDDE